MEKSSFQDEFISEVNKEMEKIKNYVDELWNEYLNGKIDVETHRKLERPYMYNLLRLESIKHNLQDLQELKR